jgi:15-cis-phytoene synthase
MEMDLQQQFYTEDIYKEYIYGSAETVMKHQIENDIAEDFRKAYLGILKLPWKAKFGVYVAYKYYFSLFNKIKKLHPARIMDERIRIPDYSKVMILARAGLKNQLNLL